MNRFSRAGLSALVFALCAACGGDSSDMQMDRAYLQAVPSEELLCSFVIGETSRQDIMDALGEPTNVFESASGSSLQYWVRSEPGSPRVILFGFEPDGILSDMLTQQVPFPECWREQLDAIEASFGAD